MFIDSHCHLDRVDLTGYTDFNQMIQATKQANVKQMLCVCIDLESYPDMLSLVEGDPDIDVSVGVHPTAEVSSEPDINTLVDLAIHEKNVAIGETGLDYFYGKETGLSVQRERFVVHIEAAKQAEKPLIIHTRQARDDTVNLLTDHQADTVGGVLHCFTEDWATAKAGLDLNFYVSFSGIITFKNASDLRDVVKKVPMDRLLIETDSPYLAPVPHRGKGNQPRYVCHVAEQVAKLKGLSVEEVAMQTADNYWRLFGNGKTRD
ncbi:MAG: TatD family hydrolase [Methylococcales bacterium]|jgi:TatD DNase family protein|nr:TatD family hydrolase [Methylococcales bacterium]MBT7444378.1 TatD family hydrolase [Methylococcales bacterium]